MELKETRVEDITRRALLYKIQRDLGEKIYIYF